MSAARTRGGDGVSGMPTNAYSIRFASNRSGSSDNNARRATIATPNTPARSATSIANQSTRNRKLTPTAKAKAQASASRALREQLQATKVAGSDIESIKEAIISGRTEESSASDKEAVDIESNSEEAATATSQPITPTPLIRRIRDVYAYATAESYNFEMLIASGRLPPQWQLIEDGNVIYI